MLLLELLFIHLYLNYAVLLIPLEVISVHAVRQGITGDPLIPVHSALGRYFGYSNFPLKINLQPLVDVEMK